MFEDEIVIMGNPSLLEKSAPIDKVDADVIALVEKLKIVMAEKQGVGIAAPQIGINKRVIVFGFEHNARYPNKEPVPFTILINPSYEVLSDEIAYDWEGCISVPGLRGLVPRYTKIKYKGTDLDGNKIEREAEGFHARLIQHELDHLDGILFPMRIEDMKDFGFEQEIFARIGLAPKNG